MDFRRLFNDNVNSYLLGKSQEILFLQKISHFSQRVFFLIFFFKLKAEYDFIYVHVIVFRTLFFPGFIFPEKS